MKKYRHIFFDLDRTIWDFEKNARETFSEIYDKYELKQKGVPSLEKFTKTYKYHNDLLWSYYREGKIKKEVLSIKRFKLTLNDFGIDDVFLATNIADDYVTISPLKTNLFPHSREILEYLYPKYKLHLITNGFEEVQQKKIDVSDLRKYFKQIITSEEAGTKKPEKQIFLFALSKAKAKINESLMIGDDLRVDIMGAKSAGIDQVFVNYKNITHNNEITYEVNSLKELEDLL
ncbi:MAG: noncanonical pyrimidine nucleotidase, YjjG family [Bacteroidetes bacterium]|nr:noncanonical pyrimidine nucleotidase, YjjG family [Bacteroidota bacterium]MCK4360593.1 YjjG family noncanonical pyrimidine nucleotidase [Bacteroidales bacterium]